LRIFNGNAVAGRATMNTKALQFNCKAFLFLSPYALLATPKVLSSSISTLTTQSDEPFPTLFKLKANSIDMLSAVNK
jgi:hypothetical protein